MYVQITQIDETKNNLILSEKEAWVSIQICLFSILSYFLASLFPKLEFLGFSFSLLSFEISDGKDGHSHPGSRFTVSWDFGSRLVGRLDMIYVRVLVRSAIQG